MKGGKMPYGKGGKMPPKGTYPKGMPMKKGK